MNFAPISLVCADYFNEMDSDILDFPGLNRQFSKNISEERGGIFVQSERKITEETVWVDVILQWIESEDWNPDFGHCWAILVGPPKFWEQLGTAVTIFNNRNRHQVDEATQNVFRENETQCRTSILITFFFV